MKMMHRLNTMPIKYGTHFIIQNYAFCLIIYNCVICDILNKQR